MYNSNTYKSIMYNNVKIQIANDLEITFCLFSYDFVNVFPECQLLHRLSRYADKGRQGHTMSAVIFL